MSHCAEGEINLVLKSKPSEEVLDDISNVINTVVLYYDVKKRRSVLEGLHKLNNYHEDDVKNALDKLTPYVESGVFTFEGEDGSHWRFKFERKSRTWKEQSGHIVYS